MNTKNIKTLLTLIIAIAVFHVSMATTISLRLNQAFLNNDALENVVKYDIKPFFDKLVSPDSTIVITANIYDTHTKDKDGKELYLEYSKEPLFTSDYDKEFIGYIKIDNIVIVLGNTFKSEISSVEDKSQEIIIRNCKITDSAVIYDPFTWYYYVTGNKIFKDTLNNPNYEKQYYQNYFKHYK